MSHAREQAARHNERVPQYAEIQLADHTPVRLELTPVGDPPEGIAGPFRTGHGPAVVAHLAEDALHAVLRPLGPLLQHVHDSITVADNPPNQITVQFGVVLGDDLKLGIVGANGQACMTVSATWGTPFGGAVPPGTGPTVAQRPTA